MAGWYEQREKALKRLGYKDYSEYLHSPRWKAIRSRVLKRSNGTCEACGMQAATEVHHRSYCLDAMRGKRIDFLAACCRTCHEDAEFWQGIKVKPKTANRRMSDSARQRNITLPGLCISCYGNPTRKGWRLCGKCNREQQQILAEKKADEDKQ